MQFRFKALDIRIFTIVGLAFMSLSCSPGAPTGSCAPNVIDTGLQLRVTALGADSNSNAYAFELCAAALSPSAVYTVYGGVTADSVSPTGMSSLGAWRVRQITEATTAGSKFQVTFMSSDNYFAVYKDLESSPGVFVFDLSQSLVSPHRIPGR